MKFSMLDQVMCQDILAPTTPDAWAYSGFNS